MMRLFPVRCVACKHRHRHHLSADVIWVYIFMFCFTKQSCGVWCCIQASQNCWSTLKQPWVTALVIYLNISNFQVFYLKSPQLYSSLWRLYCMSVFSVILGHFFFLFYGRLEYQSSFSVLSFFVQYISCFLFFVLILFFFFFSSFLIFHICPIFPLASLTLFSAWGVGWMTGVRHSYRYLRLGKLDLKSCPTGRLTQRTQEGIPPLLPV